MANKAVLGVAATALAGYKLHELAKGYAVERELKKEEDERELLQELASISTSHPKGKGGLFGGLFS